MATRTDPDKHRAQVRAANRARHAANNALKERHREEWDRLYAAAARKEGVTPKPREAPEVVQLKGRIAELTAQLETVAGKATGRVKRGGRR